MPDTMHLNGRILLGALEFLAFLPAIRVDGDHDDACKNGQEDAHKSQSLVRLQRSGRNENDWKRDRGTECYGGEQDLQKLPSGPSPSAA